MKQELKEGQYWWVRNIRARDSASIAEVTYTDSYGFRSRVPLLLFVGSEYTISSISYEFICRIKSPRKNAKAVA